MRQYRRIVKVKRLEKVIDELYEKQKRLHGIKTLSRSNEESAEAAESFLEGGAEARAMKDLERSILKELRPRLDPNKPLVDVIDTEKRRDEPPSYDDRVIKQLERKYGERPGVRPFGADDRDGARAAGSFSPLSPPFPTQRLYPPSHWTLFPPLWPSKLFWGFPLLAATFGCWCPVLGPFASALLAVFATVLEV